jgi:MFS family permease
VLIGAMTAAFAVGQIAGPLLVAALVRVPGGFSWALALSALPLLVAAAVLHRRPAQVTAVKGARNA